MEPGQQVSVYYDADDPTIAVLRPGLTATISYLALGAGGGSLLIALLGLGGLVTRD